MATTKTLQGNRTVDGPTLVARTGGLLDNADVRTLAIGAEELRGYSFETEAGATGAVYDYGTGPAAPLTLTAGVTFKTAQTSFEVLASAEINLVEDGVFPPEQRAQDRLALVEPRLVEYEFLTDFLAPAAADITPTPGTAVRPAVALALLAEYAGSHYVGLPTIHAGLRAGVILGEPYGLVERANGKTVLTADGSPVAVGAGYSRTAKPTAAAAVTVGANQAFLWATGKVVLLRSAVDTYRGVLPELNDDGAFAIRTYVPAIETFAVAVLTDLS